MAVSPIIVHGQVTAVRTEWLDGRRSVETILTLDVTDYLKGDLGPQITIAVPGGQIGRYRTIMVGAPVFETGDEVVLFLKGGASHPFIVGLSQGAFRVVAAPGTSAKLVTPPTVMAPRGGEIQPVVRGDLSRRPVSIDRFRDIVRQVIAEAGPR